MSLLSWVINCRVETLQSFLPSIVTGNVQGGDCFLSLGLRESTINKVALLIHSICVVCVREIIL